MEYDQAKVDEIVLALLFLTVFEESPYGARGWKGHDWNVLDRLHRKGYISDPRSKAKSVVVTEEGVKAISRPFREILPERKSLTISSRLRGAIFEASRYADPR